MKSSLAKVALVATLLFTAWLSQHCAVPESSLPLIVGGYDVPDDHPGQSSAVGISYRWQAHCTGALVGDDLIVTAAHCLERVTNLDQLRVHFASQIDRSHPELTRSVADFASHEEYSYPSNDIAWLRLTEMAPDEAQATPIIDSSLLNKEEALHLVGYGVTDDDRQVAKRGTRLMVDTVFRQHIESDYYHGLFVYGPTPGKSACFGDSGGPVYVHRNNEWYLAGIATGSDFIVAQTELCAAGNGIVTSLWHHRQWWSAQHGADIR